MSNEKQPYTEPKIESEIQIDAHSKVRLENGDILVVRVPKDAPMASVVQFRKFMSAEVKRLGVNATVVIVSGEVSLEVGKRADLSVIAEAVVQKQEELEARMAVIEERILPQPVEPALTLDIPVSQE